jgi:hypothetical protein
MFTELRAVLLSDTELPSCNIFWTEHNESALTFTFADVELPSLTTHLKDKQLPSAKLLYILHKPLLSCKSEAIRKVLRIDKFETTLVVAAQDTLDEALRTDFLSLLLKLMAELTLMVSLSES